MATGAVGAYTGKPNEEADASSEGPHDADASQGPPWRCGHGASLVNERTHDLLMTSVTHAETFDFGPTTWF